MTSATSLRVINLLKGNLNGFLLIDMVFDDDVKLVGLYGRYEDESEEMKR